MNDKFLRTNTTSEAEIAPAHSFGLNPALEASMASTQHRIEQEKKQQWREIKKALKDKFHFDQLRPGQEGIIRSVLAGNNTLAIMPTGAGKSLCYQLPALQLPGTTIVISPLISLMKDQREKVEEKGIAAVELNSTITANEAKSNMAEIANETAEILYVTPERFSNPEFLEEIRSSVIDFVVIDEAHCVSHWGHDFRPAYLSIGENIRKLGSPPILALTATATEEVAEDIKRQLGLKELEIFRSSIFRDNLRFEAKYLDRPEEKFSTLLDLLSDLKTESGIIYTATVRAAEDIHEFLSENGIPSLLYHGKLKPKEREENQNEFMSNTPRLMIATNAFGMGIDKPDIRFVIHFQFPSSLEAYYQEAGRAGRDGELARCILLYLKRDKSTQSLFLSGKYPSSDEVKTTYDVLKTLAQNSKPIPRADLEEVLKEHIPVKKLAVILSLLKQLKILKESREKEICLLKNNLSSVHIENLSSVYQQRAERDRTKLNRVITYAQSALCRWKNILQYFNEDPVESCGRCDNCKRGLVADLGILA